MDLIRRPEGLSREWLATVLRGSGAVTECETDPIGTGRMSDS